MHELSIADGIVEVCAERALGPRVLRVRLEIGRLSCVAPEALDLCFDVCAKNMVVEGAVLEIVRLPGRARCRGCGGEIEVASLTEVCGCGASDLRVVAGEELRLKEMELA